MAQDERISTASHVRQIRRVLWLVFSLNLIVAAAKFVYGVLSFSSAMQADGIHSFFDSMGNIVGLVAIGLAGRPADESHPYGHSKYETYGSLVIGLFLLFAAFEVGQSAVTKLITQDFNAEVTGVSFAVMLGTLGINICVTIYERRKGNKLGSELLKADAAHTLSDVLVSVGVILGLALVAAGFPAADPIFALGVTVAILISAFQVFKAALKTLSDTSRIPYHDIARCVEPIDGIVNVHHVRTRGTESEVYCDIRIVVDPKLPLEDAHHLGEKAKQAILEAYPDIKEVLVQVEPLGFHRPGDVKIRGQEDECLTPTQEQWLQTEQGRQFLTPNWSRDFKRDQKRQMEEDQSSK